MLLKYDTQLHLLYFLTALSNTLMCSSPTPSDRFDSYIMVSFVNATLVLSIGETVEEVTDSGFLGTTPTLACSQLGDDALVQVRMNTDGTLHIGLLFFNVCEKQNFTELLRTT